MAEVDWSKPGGVQSVARGAALPGWAHTAALVAVGLALALAWVACVVLLMLPFWAAAYLP